MCLIATDRDTPEYTYVCEAEDAAGAAGEDRDAEQGKLFEPSDHPCTHSASQFINTIVYTHWLVLCAYNQIGYLIVSKFIDEDFADEDAKPVTAIVGLQAVLMHAIVHACMCRFC